MANPTGNDVVLLATQDVTIFPISREGKADLLNFGEIAPKRVESVGLTSSKNMK